MATRRIGQTKSEFIRRYPYLSPAELAATGKKAGIELSVGFVSAVRSRDRMRPRLAGPSKSAFIRRYPYLPPAELVAAGKQAGIEFSLAFVSAIRSRDRAGEKPKTSTRSTRSADVKALERMAIELGIPTVRKALDDLERRLAALLGC
jgi:hypothetical protein